MKTKEELSKELIEEIQNKYPILKNYQVEIIKTGFSFKKMEGIYFILMNLTLAI